MSPPAEPEAYLIELFGGYPRLIRSVDMLRKSALRLLSTLESLIRQSPLTLWLSGISFASIW